MKLAAYWNGQEPLNNAFWYAWVIPAILIPILSAVLTVVIGYLAGFPPYQLAIVIFIVILFLNPYYIYAWVSVWRCGKNNQSLIWRNSTRFLVLLNVVLSASYALIAIPEFYLLSQSQL